jgi:hypothetical protein
MSIATITQTNASRIHHLDAGNEEQKKKYLLLFVAVRRFIPWRLRSQCRLGWVERRDKAVLEGIRGY